MRKLKSKIKFSALLAILLLGVITNSSAQKKVIVEEFAKKPPYPASFTKQKSHILVITYEKDSPIPDYERNSLVRNLSSDLQKDFPKDYTGDIDFIVMGKDIEDESKLDNNEDRIFKYNVINSAFSDTAKYRFIFFYEGYIESQGMATIQDFKFGLLDRVDDSFALTNLHSGSHGPLMEAYIKKLEEVRVK